MRKELKARLLVGLYRQYATRIERRLLELEQEKKDIREDILENNRRIMELEKEIAYRENLNKQVEFLKTPQSTDPWWKR